MSHNLTHKICQVGEVYDFIVEIKDSQTPVILKTKQVSFDQLVLEMISEFLMI